MTRKRGGQPKHWAEVARVQAWYEEVKRRSLWSDYKLDFEFAWTEEGMKSRDESHPADRPRTFEWIRKTARKPRGRDFRWRDMAELVEVVGEHPWFKGTRELYEADLWDLLQETTPTPDATQIRLERLLAAHGLVRLPAERALANGGALVMEFGLPSLFGRCLKICLQHIDCLSGIALAWLLFLQLEPAHNARIRAMVESIAGELLDHFFFDYFPDNHFEYYTDAIGTLLQTRLDLSSRGLNGYGSLETIGTWPIVPGPAVGKLSKQDLFRSQ